MVESKSRVQLLVILVVFLAAFFSLSVVANIDALRAIGFVGLEVPDAISLKMTLSNIFDGKAGIDKNYQTFAGLVYAYKLAYIGLSKNYFLTNIVMLIIASIAFIEIMRSEQYHMDGVIIGLVFSIFCLNPYTIAIFNFPNKEIPIFALLNVAIYFFLVRNNLIMALVFLLPIYWIRDGYFWISSTTFILCFLTAGTHRWMRSFIVLGMLLLFVAVPVDILGYGDSAMKRSIDTAQALKNDGVVIFANYLTRLYYSLVSFALFTPFLMLREKFSFLNFGYFLQGLVVVAYFVKTLTRKNVLKFIENDIDFIILVQVLMLSFSLYVQPRYIFPLICFMSASVFDGQKKMPFLMLVLCCLVSVLVV